LTHNPESSVRDVEFLKVGRHFRLSAQTKLVCGRNRSENHRLCELARPDDVVISSHGVPGPTAVLIGVAADDVLNVAASLVVRYSDASAGTAGRVCVETRRPACRSGRSERIIEARAASQELIDRLQIK